MTEERRPDNYLKLGSDEIEVPDGDIAPLRARVEPWLSAVLQSEHLSILLGNGFSTAVAGAAGAPEVPMDEGPLDGPSSDKVENAAARSADEMGRGTPNLEDRLRTGLTLLAGLRVLESDDADAWESALDEAITNLVKGVLATERGIADAVRSDPDRGTQARKLLVSFLLTFASRSASRERLHIATTNYDRLVEFGCDLAGLRILDRFVGGLEPIFRATRIETDIHYSPPGIRGEPRYLEGVLRLSKLHGSLDWRADSTGLRRVGLPFGAPTDHPGIPSRPTEDLMVYPNSGKDIETSLYPYAEIFRDISAAFCRPNSALLTYGYGFGDDHINRILRDMASIPSTHLVIISYDWCDARIRTFLNSLGPDAAVSLIIGPRLADLNTLVTHLLPKPAIDTITLRRAELLSRRQPQGGHEGQPSSSEHGSS